MIKRFSPAVRRRRKPQDPSWKKFFSDDESEERARQEEVFDTSLADTTLSVRLVNTLEGRNILTVRDLARQSRDDLLDIGNLGEQMLLECHKAMVALNVPHPAWHRRPPLGRKKKKAPSAKKSPAPRSASMVADDDYFGMVTKLSKKWSKQIRRNRSK